MRADRSGYGILGDESFERSRQRIGIPMRISPANITEVTADCMGENAAPPPTPEQKELLKGDPFAGLGSYQAEMEFEYYRPLAAGDRRRESRSPSARSWDGSGSPFPRNMTARTRGWSSFAWWPRNSAGRPSRCVYRQCPDRARARPMGPT